jgi:hypothetical protein
MADCYVYVYIDPRNNEEFYYGKGAGIPEGRSPRRRVRFRQSNRRQLRWRRGSTTGHRLGPRNKSHQQRIWTPPESKRLIACKQSSPRE